MWVLILWFEKWYLGHFLLSFKRTCLKFENNPYQPVTGSESGFSNTVIKLVLNVCECYIK